jgi:hypothetical protein
VTEEDRREPGEPPRWLTDTKVGSWLSVVRMMTWLPWSVDQQLRRMGLAADRITARIDTSEIN